MNCKQFARHIAAYMEGSLDSDAANGVKAHLSACAACAVLVRELDNASSLVQSLEREPAPEGFEDRLRARIAARPPVVARRGVWGRLVNGVTGGRAPGRQWQIALRPMLAMLVLCVVLGGSVLIAMLGTHRGSSETDWEYIETCQQQHALFASANPLADGSAIILKERARDLESEQ